jgi:hypothetical protein
MRKAGREPGFFAAEAKGAFTSITPVVEFSDCGYFRIYYRELEDDK